MPQPLKPAFRLGTVLRVVGEDSGRYQGAEGPFVRFQADAPARWWNPGERWAYGVDLTHAGIEGVKGVRFFGRSEVDPCQGRQTTAPRSQPPATTRVASKRPAAKKRK